MILVQKVALITYYFKVYFGPETCSITSEYQKNARGGRTATVLPDWDNTACPVAAT